MNNLEILQEAAIGECHIQSDADYHVMRFNDFAVSVSPPLDSCPDYCVMAGSTEYTNYSIMEFFPDFASAMDYVADLLRSN